MGLFLKKTVGYIILCWLVNLGLGYYLSTYESKDLKAADQFFPAMRWEEFYQRSIPSEVIVLGSSHAYRAYVPGVLGEALGLPEAVFNLGSSAQSPVTSYYVLQEVVRKHKPKLVIFDLYHMVFTADEQLKNGRYNWLQMKNGPVKKQFFLEGFSFSDQVSLLLFPTYTYRDHLKGKLYKLLGRNYLPPEKGHYQGTGFVSNPDTLSMEKLMNNNQFDVFTIDTTAMTNKNLLYLKKLKDYCYKEQISLVFVTAPMPAVSVGKISGYSNFHDLFANLADEWGVSYLDYNTSRVPLLNDSTHYYDDDHLNTAGAIIFSKAVAEDIKALK